MKKNHYLVIIETYISPRIGFELPYGPKTEVELEQAIKDNLKEKGIVYKNIKKVFNDKGYNIWRVK